MSGSVVIGPYFVDDHGKLPVRELSSDRPGASSPFGDDLSFPLPLELLTYAHPTGTGHAANEPAGH